MLHALQSNVGDGEDGHIHARVGDQYRHEHPAGAQHQAIDLTLQRSAGGAKLHQHRPVEPEESGLRAGGHAGTQQQQHKHKLNH